MLAATGVATAATTCTDSVNGDLPGAWAATVNHTVLSSSGVVTDGDMTLATRLSGTPTVLDGDVAGGQVVPQNPGATGCVNQYCTVTVWVGNVTPNDAGSGWGFSAGTFTHHRRSVLGRGVTHSATINGALTLSIWFGGPACRLRVVPHAACLGQVEAAVHRGRLCRGAGVGERWYRNGVIYSLDVRAFQDANGDGVGDLQGLISRVDYLSRLGVTTLWLSPIHPSPWRDGGYDVTDHYNIDPSLGSLGDFAELMNVADERGLRVMLDLVLNHTSEEHPWFRSACSDPRSPYRDWYVWSEHEPPDRSEGMVFPGVQQETWTYSDQAGAWYHHRFYDFQPDLNIRNPEVREELGKIVSFWERLGVSGYRVDAAPFVIEMTEPGGDPEDRDYTFLTELRENTSWRRGDAVFLAEANVANADLVQFFGDADGAAHRLQMLFAFRLNESLMLSLARQDSHAVAEALATLPPLPRHGQWATFLRNHDEVDLSQLSESQRQEVFAAFGPDRRQQLYGRGIRRRLATMLDGEQRQLRMAFSLQFTMPGTPVLRYGDEIGMGEDLRLPERDAMRTPMQWSATANAGFSTAPADDLVRPVLDEGPYSYEHVNVTDQRRDPNSLLAWFDRMLHTRRECQEIGIGDHQVIPVEPTNVLAHRAEAPSGSVVFIHNLSDQPARVCLPEQPDEDNQRVEVFSDREYDDPDLRDLKVDGYGYRWIRLRRNHSRR